MKRSSNINPLYIQEGEVINNLVRKVVHTAKNDNGLKGKALRVGNLALDLGKGAAVAATPPMPSLDARAVRNISQTAKALKNNASSRLSGAVRLGRTLKHPIKTTKRFLDRTITGAVTDMPSLTIPGVYSGTNPFYGVATGVSPSEIYNFMKQTKDYTVGGARHYIGKIKGFLTPKKSMASNLMPSY